MITEQFFVVGHTPWESLGLDQTTGKRRYRKQTIYEGSFLKRAPGQPDLKFSVDRGMIDHWKKSHDDLAAEGIEVPLPLGHTENAEKRRGTVVGASTGLDAKGRYSLYHDVEFSRPEHEHLINSDVSLWCPEKFTSGSGKEYRWPIKHVAITDYPVIPGLEKFQALACSYELLLDQERDEPSPGSSGTNKLSFDQLIGHTDMGMQQVAMALGINQPTLPDAQLEPMIIAAIQKLKPPAQPGAQPAGGPAPPPTPPPAPAPAGPSRAFSFSPAMAGILRDNRMLQLGQLLDGGSVSKPIYDELVAEYCSDTALALSLSADEDDEDRFKIEIGRLARNEQAPVKGRTRPQLAKSLKLSREEHSDKVDDNFLNKDAARRAKENTASAN